MICIVDSNEAFHGTRRLGISVESPSSVLEHPKALVIVNTVSVKAIQSAMKTMGIKNDYLIIGLTVIFAVAALVFTFADGSRFYNPFI